MVQTLAARAGLNRQHLAIYGVLTIAAALVVALGMKVVTLEDQTRSLNDRLRTLQPGDYVPTFSATALSGNNLLIGEMPDSGRQVIFIFTTTCPFCEASLPVLKQLSARADTFSARPITVQGITMDGPDETRDYIARHRLDFDVVGFPAPKLARLYRVTSVPQTFVLDHDGRVLYARTGVMDNAAVADSIWQAAQPR
jgi:peroxiredoxin